MVAIINCVLAFSLFASGRSSADVPSCQASGSCDGNDDAMLIQAARSSSVTVSKMLRDGQSATQLLDKINDMADRIVTGQEKITDATRLALDSIDGEMDNIITHAKSNSVDFQKVVERAAESIEQCASTTRKAHDKELGEEGIDALAAAVASSRNDHITCRTDEAVLKGDETTKCDALKTYVDGLTMPTCTCSDTPVTKQCVTELSTWSATASSTWSTHQGLCNNATTAQSTKRTACNGQQGALESVFCSYKTSLSLVCRTQDTCRLDEIALRNKAHESVEVSESAFKAEYESAKHVKCILQVLNATDDAKQGMLSDCRSASVDSSNLTIAYPQIPGPANCDRSPVSHPPGDDKWRTDEYQRKTWNADGKAPVVATAANCAAEATSTTAVPATTAAPTTAAATSTTAVPATTAAPTTAPTLNTDGYHFEFGLDVRFNNWDGEDWPAVLHSSADAFSLHGLGPGYNSDKGKLTFYIKTLDNVGVHGRGGGQVVTSAKLNEGVWYHVTVTKTADQVCIQLGIDTPTCATRTVTADQFQMKGVGALSWDAGSNIEGKNFMQKA